MLSVAESAGDTPITTIFPACADRGSTKNTMSVNGMLLKMVRLQAVISVPSDGFMKA
ncbi:MAG: hypothetical protein WCQ90_15105 [Deltaproteobacteria bacterium]